MDSFLHNLNFERLKKITCPSSSSIVQLAVSYLKSYLLESIMRKKKLKIPKTWVFHRRYTLYSRRFIGLIHHCSAPSRYVRIVIVCTHCNSIPSAYGNTGLFCQTSNWLELRAHNSLFISNMGRGEWTKHAIEIIDTRTPHKIFRTLLVLFHIIRRVLEQSQHGYSTVLAQSQIMVSTHIQHRFRTFSTHSQRGGRTVLAL